MQNRGRLIRVLYEHARDLDIDIRLGSTVTDYWETETEAGLTARGLEGEERVSGDCVICSDGVHSHGRAAIVGEDPPGSSTGWATFRGHLSTTELLAEDPKTRWIVEAAQKRDIMRVYIGDGLSFAFWTIGHGKEMVWIITHEVIGSLITCLHSLTRY